MPRFTLPFRHKQILLFIGMAASAAASAQPAMLQQASDIDWVSYDDLNPEQQALLQDDCCGMYVEPELPPLKGEPGSVNLTADAMDTRGQSQVSLDGNVEVRFDGLSLGADSGLYDSASGDVSLQGNIQMRKQGTLLVGTDATVNNAGATGTLNNASYVLHEEGIRGSAEIIVYTDDQGIITIDNGLYTRCEPGNNSWVIEGREIVLNQVSGRGRARDVKLRLGDVTVLYLPVITFSINDERATGFLAPTMGSTRDGGLDFSAPFYLNLAPNYDATLLPRLMTDRGVMFGLEGRHRGRRSQNTLLMNYLPNDDLFDESQLLLPDPESPPVADRWLLDYEHTGRPARGWTTLVDYSAISDEDYFQDLGNTGLYNTTRSYLFRQGGASYRNNNWRFRAQALSYQVIDPNIPEISQPYKQLPKIDLTGTFASDLGFEYGVKSEFVKFDRDLDPDNLTPAQLASGIMVTGERLTVEPELSFSWSNPGAFITPKAKYSYASYALNDPTDVYTDNPSRGVFTGSLDSGLIFDRELDLDSGSMLQTLEPRIFYLFNEFENQDDIPVFDSTEMTFGFNQLFRENRFSGKDRVGDTSQLTLALSTRFLNDRGREKASASIGQIRYFKDRRVTLNNRLGADELTNRSAIASEFTYEFNDNWRVNSYLEYNTNDNNLEVGNFQFRYQSDINHILNFGYRYRDSPNPITAAGFDRRIKQTDISAVWPVSANWVLIGRWNYDHANSRNLETIAGFEYTNCCYSVRIISRKWIDNDALFYGNMDNNTGIFLQFELKGLGSVLGGNVTGILNNGINGYRDREYTR